MDVKLLHEWLMQGGALALLAIVIIYSLRVLLPRTIDRFTESLALQRKDFRDALDRERQSFENLLQIEHDRWLEAMERMSDAIDRLAERVEDQQ